MKTPPLSKELQEQLLQDFCEALVSLRMSREALPFLTDLLTKTEVRTLAKRLQVAFLLVEGKDYRTIAGELKTSHGTIARVAVWLQESGEGFRLAAERTQGKRKQARQTAQKGYGEWAQMKRRYPMMFWPQLLLEEVVRNANAKERKRLQSAIKNLNRKSDLYRRLQKVLSDTSQKKRKHRNGKNFNAT